jgi:hypothetical protein
VNLDQADSGGIASTEPDRIGDACQCGDVTGDGIVDRADAEAIRTGRNDTLAVPGNCDVTGNGTCDDEDGEHTAMAVSGSVDWFDLAPQGQNCQNANPLAPPCTNCGQ